MRPPPSAEQRERIEEHLRRVRELGALIDEQRAPASAETDFVLKRISDARGAAIVAHMEGRSEGLKEGLQEAIVDLCEVLGIPLDAEQRSLLDAMSASDLRALRERLKRERRF